MRRVSTDVPAGLQGFRLRQAQLIERVGRVTPRSLIRLRLEAELRDAVRAELEREGARQPENEAPWPLAEDEDAGSRLQWWQR